MTHTDLTEYLAENPRMMGVVFAVLLVLSQAGSAAAAFGPGIVGP